MLASIIITDLIIDAIVPVKSQAFVCRLITNISVVLISALIYFWKK